MTIEYDVENAFGRPHQGIATNARFQTDPFVGRVFDISLPSGCDCPINPLPA